VNRLKLLALQSRQSAIGRLEMATNRSGGSKRGFAAMDPAKQREIASKGGKASHGGGRKSSSHR
jgi:general stress protein YciG